MPKLFRLLAISNFHARYGTSRSVMEDLTDIWRRQGYQITCASYLRSPLRKAANMLWTAYRARRNYDFALIEVYSGRAFLWAEWTAQIVTALQKPILFTLHGGGLPAFSLKHPNRVRFLLKKAKRVVTPSLYLQKELAIFRKDIQHLPNPIHLEDYPWRKREICAPKLVWLRAFEKASYNPLMAAQGIKILRENCPQVHLMMIGADKGDGSMQEVQRFIQAHGLQANCQIIPGIPKTEVLRALSQADIFLNTTNLESFGISVMEAAALGLPVVSTNVGELPYLWTDEQNALLVPPGDAPAMAAAVERLLREPVLAARLSENGRRKAEEYDLPAILPQWEALFEKITVSTSSHG